MLHTVDNSLMVNNFNRLIKAISILMVQGLTYIIAKTTIMTDQTIEVSNQQVAGPIEHSASTSYPEAAFWLHVYPPLGDRKVPMPDARMICPWTLAAELADDGTASPRRQNILEALKRGLKTIRQYGLPAYRILFAEEHSTRMISVWVD
jgi:hypothetical protein